MKTLLALFSIFAMGWTSYFDFSKQYVVQEDDLYCVCDNNGVDTGVVTGDIVFKSAGESS